MFLKQSQCFSCGKFTISIICLILFSLFLLSMGMCVWCLGHRIDVVFSLSPSLALMITLIIMIKKGIIIIIIKSLDLLWICGYCGGIYLISMPLLFPIIKVKE